MIDEAICEALFAEIHRSIAEFTIAAISIPGSSEAPTSTYEPEGFPSPMLLYALWGLFLLGVAIIIVATAVAFGIIFSAAFVGILRRRFSAGLRAFHYQLCAIGGLLIGVCGLWASSQLIGPRLDIYVILAVGSTIGIGCGLLIAFALDRLTCIAYRQLVKKTIPNDRNP